MPTKNKRLLFVVNEPWFFISHRLPIARRAHELGYEVHVATPYGDGVSQIISENFLFHEVPLKRSSIGLAGEVKAILVLARIYKNVKPDIVHHVTIKPVIYGTLIARIFSVPVVVNAISGLGFVFISKGVVARIRRSIVLRLYRFLLNHHSVHVIFQNPDDMNLFYSMGLASKDKSSLIKGSGVDVKLFVPGSELDEVPTVLLVARMLWDKGVGEFVEAARMLRKEEVNAQFILVGDIDIGNPKSIDKKQLHKWCSTGDIEWLGHQKNISQIMVKSHVICLPSYREGLPKTLIESAAAGKPIVTTDVPGCREVVRNEINGFLVPPKNPEALATAIRKLLLNKQLRVEMGKQGRRIAVEEFSVEQVVKETIFIYEKLS